MDKEKFDDNRAYVPEAVNTLPNQTEAFQDLLTDAFGALYKYAPIVNDEVDSDRTLNRHIISEMMQLSEYKQLRNYTTGDCHNAAGSLEIIKTIRDKLPDSVKEAQENTEDISRQIEEALDSNTYDPDAIQELLEDAKSAEQELTEQVDEWQDQIRQIVRQVLGETEQETADTEQAVACLGWGQGSGGNKTPTSPQDKLKISQALKHNKKLQDIIRMAGRMTNLAQKKQRQKAQYFRTEVTGIEQGDDLPNVVPSEYGYLLHGNKALHLLFLKRYSQAELVQYQMEAREPKAQGPILVAIDCSGSMYGDPDIWSKACALAMYSIARKQKRSFGVLLFEDRVTSEVFIEKGQHRPQDLISILSAGVGGGTSFEQPLSRAIELIKTDQHKKADLIVITDGVCDISDQFKQTYDREKKLAEFSTYTILIGGSDWEVKTAKKFSDSVTELKDMLRQNEGQAFDVVFAI